MKFLGNLLLFFCFVLSSVVFWHIVVGIFDVPKVIIPKEAMFQEK